MRNKMWTVLFALVALALLATPAQANADDSFNGYAGMGFVGGASSGLGYDDMSSGLSAQVETPGKFRVIAVVSSFTASKYSTDDFAQTNGSLGLKYMLNDNWGVAAGYRMSYLGFDGGSRTDKSPFLLVSRSWENTSCDGILRFPDTSQYETRSIGIGCKNLLQLSKKWYLLTAPVLNYIEFDHPNGEKLNGWSYDFVIGAAARF